MLDDNPGQHKVASAFLNGVASIATHPEVSFSRTDLDGLLGPRSLRTMAEIDRIWENTQEEGTGPTAATTHRRLRARNVVVGSYPVPTP